jgi:hypothetical protein
LRDATQPLARFAVMTPVKTPSSGVPLREPVIEPLNPPLEV